MVEPLKGIQLPQPWQGFIERITKRVNNSATKPHSMPLNNVFVADVNGDLKDSGIQLPSETLVGTEYVGERFITESTLREAGEEEGARHGSYRIGILSDNDYAFFDEYGKLILYGVAGIQLITPLNDLLIPNKYVVFDTNGNLKYRTRAQLINDVSSSIEKTIEQWVAERFITENLLDEAEVNDNPYLYSDNLGDDGLFVLPSLSYGARGTLVVGSDEERADFSISSAGTVNLIMSSANVVVNANTDGKFCIGTAAAQNPIVVKNRLGSPKWVTLVLWGR